MIDGAGDDNGDGENENDQTDAEPFTNQSDHLSSELNVTRW